MKKIYTLLTLTLLFVGNLLSQTNNLIVFTLEPQPFYVILNGIRQNEEPRTNVKITELPGEFYRMKIIFTDGKTPDLEKSISYLEMGKEVSVELRQKKGKWKVRYAGEVALNSSPTIPNQTNVTYHEAQNTGTLKPASTQTTSTTHVQSDIPKAPIQQSNTHIKENQSTSTTSTNGTVNSTISTNTQGSQVNVSTSETGINMNVSIEDPTIDIPNENEMEQQVQTTTTYSGFMNNGSMCPTPTMSQRDYMDFKYKIEAENMFNREKLILATFQKNCMLASQVAGIIQLKYSTVDEMTIAKQAYRYTYDTENYGLVVSTLQSQSKQKELLTFLNASVSSTTSSSSSSHVTSTHQTTTSGSTSANISINQDTGSSRPTSTTTGVKPNNSTTINSIGSNSQTSNTSNQLVDYGWVNGYRGTIGCYSSQLVNEEEIIKIAEEESFSEGRMNTVKRASKGKCLTVDQISSISAVFTFEADKLEFVKWAFDSTYDVDNYYKLNSIFTFSSSKDELNEYLEGR